MFRKFSLITAFTLVCFCTTHAAHAQSVGLRLQVGGYGNGIRITGYRVGNGYYNIYGNGYPTGYGYPYYGGPYYKVFNGGYNNGMPYTGLYPNFGSSYVGPPIYYSAPVRSYPIRRFR
jgi:hypothetical protein